MYKTNTIGLHRKHPLHLSTGVPNPMERTNAFSDGDRRSKRPALETDFRVCGSTHTGESLDKAKLPS